MLLLVRCGLLLAMGGLQSDAATGARLCTSPLHIIILFNISLLFNTRHFNEYSHTQEQRAEQPDLCCIAICEAAPDERILYVYFLPLYYSGVSCSSS